MNVLVAHHLDHISQAHYPVIGAIDIGTNSCRLLVASVNIARLGRNYFSTRQNSKNWKVIDSFARVVRLGAGLHLNSEISDSALSRTMTALEICRKKMDRNGVSRMRAVATEACRQASNGHVLAERAQKELGIKIEIISGNEEARLILAGCAGLLNPNIPYALVFDIGGGSTEMILIKISEKSKKRLGYPVPFKIISSISIPYGVVTCTESLKGFGSSSQLYHYIRSQVSFELNQFLQKNNIVDYVKENHCQMLGSSGTVTTLAAIQCGLERYDRQYVDQSFILTQNLRKICRDLSEMSEDERTKHPCVGKGRSELILAGASILEGIFDTIPLPEIRIADRGIREGILSEILVNMNRRDFFFSPNPPLSNIE